MGELVLRAYHREGRMKSVCLRYFTAYGPRCPESHAVLAMIARAFIDQNPFQVWGTGQQVRNWTHVDDIVEGTIVAAEKVDDGRGINLGTSERTTVTEAVHEILHYTNKHLELAFDPSKPTGPYNRVCDNALAFELLGWSPQYSFKAGVRQTIDWYARTHDTADVRSRLEQMLTERLHVK
jgi:nucleoside-diphosphate-sugar epimerase